MGVRAHYAALAFVAVFGAHAAAAKDEFEVVDATWTRSVQDRNPSDRLTSPSDATRLVLWTEMRATSAALQQLKAEGKLPIRHRWIYVTGATAELEKSTITDDVSGEIGAASKVSQLERELAARQFFDWRFWSEKQNLRPGTWRVEIVYANGDPVLCRTSGAPKPCKYEIKLK